MSSYIVQALKYATLTLAAAVLVIGAAALMKGGNTSSLSGRLVAPQQNGQIPTVHFDADRAIDGYSIPADVHAVFTIPTNIRASRTTFLGGPDRDQDTRYWGYCYSGNEERNKAAGKVGNAIYDGRFFFSHAERKAEQQRPQPSDSGLLGVLKSTTQALPQAHLSDLEIFDGGQTCYVMTERELAVGVDTDGDDLNNKREQLLNTDRNNPDTDHDGIGDGSEVFVTKTDPLDRDTDHDGLGDRCEDANTNGNAEQSETSALNADTDRDGLCDGSGAGSGCPEDKQTVCENDFMGQRACTSRITSPVYGEDMNENCTVDEGETDPKNAHTFGDVNDWDYKWNKVGGAPKPGKVAPLFPIPDMPAR